MIDDPLEPQRADLLTLEVFYRVHARESRQKQGTTVHPLTWSLEETTAESFADTCPVVTVGRPGDPMPPIGAVRVYCRHEADWRELVHGLLEHGGLIVLRPAASEGVQWELNEVLTGDRDRCVLLLVDAEGLPFDKQTYKDFRETVARTCGVELPMAG
jgi:hypothetical protein